MPKPNAAPYEPPAHQLAMFPEISGNSINGLGETKRRRPTPIYWHYGWDLPHKELQDYYLKKFDDKPALKDFDQKYGGRGSKVPADKPVQPVEDTPENFSSLVKAHALANAPAYAHPRRVFIVDELPLSGTNKIDRKILRDRAASETESASAA